MNKKFSKVSSCNFRVIQADKQTNYKQTQNASFYLQQSSCCSWRWHRTVQYIAKILSHYYAYDAIVN